MAGTRAAAWRGLAVLGLAACVSAGDAEAQDLPDAELREAIALARTIIAEDSAAVWPASPAAPMQLLLVHGEEDLLFCPEVDPEPDGFAPRGVDPITGCPVAARPRAFPPQLLATFPGVGGVPTVVVGTPEAVGYALPAWTATLLHEHVHQMQYAFPGYYAGVAGLDLADGDETGSWMLEYPFPYEDVTAATGFRRLAYAALDALEADEASFPEKFAAYARERRVVAAHLEPADLRYMEFQLWQEGVARWSEAALVAAAGARWPHAPAFAWGDGGDDWRELRGADLAQDGRVAFYALGAAEAALLERAGADWRARYLREPFALGPYFPDDSR